MTRTAAREIAVRICFALASGSDAAPDDFFLEGYYETLSEEDELFASTPDEPQLQYIRSLVCGVQEHRVELDALIGKYSHGWKIGRISRIAAAVLRCAMFEVLYLPEVPDAAAINEAVELAKNYEEPETVAFINGILGSFMRGEVETASAEEPEK
jgi:N utilization substance protein B